MNFFMSLRFKPLNDSQDIKGLLPEVGTIEHGAMCRVKIVTYVSVLIAAKKMGCIDLKEQIVVLGLGIVVNATGGIDR